jgi:L-lactate dehydrogenase complex protein LldE
MHFNTGDRDQALKIIRNFVELFSDADVVVSPSGSCVGMIRELYPKAAEWAGDEELGRKIASLTPKVFELSEFLVHKLGLEDVGAYYPHHVTFHTTCHSLRLLHVGDAPLRLLRNVKGLTLVELPNSEECCGFGGTFSIKNPETSAAMLKDKIDAVCSTEATVCSAGDNSCLMHIGGGLSRLGKGPKTVHLAEILASTEQEAFA